MNVLDGDIRSVSEVIASFSSALRTGDCEWPRGGTALPAAQGGGNFHEGKSCMLPCLEPAILWANTLADDLRSGTSLNGKLIVLAARLPRPCGGVTGGTGGGSDGSS